MINASLKSWKIFSEFLNKIIMITYAWPSSVQHHRPGLHSCSPEIATLTELNLAPYMLWSQTVFLYIRPFQNPILAKSYYSDMSLTESYVPSKTTVMYAFQSQHPITEKKSSHIPASHTQALNWVFFNRIT